MSTGILSHDMVDQSHISRRTALQAMAGAGAIGLAGCLGDDDDVESITISASEGGAFAELATAYQRIVSNEGENVNVTLEQTAGDVANVRNVDARETDAGAMAHVNTAFAMTDQGDFEDESVDYVAPQGFNMIAYDAHWIALEDSGIETIDDLAGRDVWAFAPGWGFRTWIELALQNYGLWEDINAVNIESGDLAGAAEEGRVEAFIFYGVNGQGVPGFITEVETRNELRAIEVTEGYREAGQTVPGLDWGEFEVYGYEQDLGTDTMEGHIEAGSLWLSDSVSDEAAYELAELSHEHWDMGREAQPNYPDHSDVGTMAASMPVEDHPIHPGIADFLEDHGEWDDSWTRAEH